MSSKSRWILVGIVVGAVLAAGLFSAGLGVGVALTQPIGIDSSDFFQARSEVVSSSSQPTSADPSPTPDATTLFKPFWETWEIIHDEYVDQPVDDLSLVRGAIEGMLESLGDPQSSYMDPDEYLQATIELDGTYEGIGAWVDPDGEYLTIISPMPGSPAKAAGLKSGDEVIAIDGEDMTGIDGNQVIRRVLGPAGSTVILSIRRQGESELLEIEVIRAEITIVSVEGELLEEGVAYVSLRSFGQDTASELQQILEELMAENPKGLILDLRGNGGGFLFSAVDVASEFIDEGLILTERFGDDDQREYQARPGGLATDVPLIILIDGGSASASEIVAGAIRDHGRGQLLGETSFGKGSVQQWISLSDDGGAVRITTARWHTPEGLQIQGEGLVPDIEILLDDEEIETDLDPQLEKAIEILTEV